MNLSPFESTKGELFAYDDHGVRYEIPLYIVQDPPNVIDDSAPAPPTEARPLTEEEKKRQEAEIPLKIRFASGKDVDLVVRGLETVLDLKKRVQERTGLPVEKQRLFFLGKLLPNEMQIALTPARPGNVLQVL